MITNILSACIVTGKVAESREFYVKHFGAKVTFDAGWYINLEFGKKTSQLQFMAPRDPGPPICNPAGLMYNFAVDDVDREYEILTRAGLTPAMPLEDHPFNGKRQRLVPRRPQAHPRLNEETAANQACR